MLSRAIQPLVCHVCSLTRLLQELGSEGSPGKRGNAENEQPANNENPAQNERPAEQAGNEEQQQTADKQDTGNHEEKEASEYPEESFMGVWLDGYGGYNAKVNTIYRTAALDQVVDELPSFLHGQAKHWLQHTTVPAAWFTRPSVGVGLTACC